MSRHNSAQRVVRIAKCVALLAFVVSGLLAGKGEYIAAACVLTAALLSLLCAQHYLRGFLATLTGRSIAWRRSALTQLISLVDEQRERLDAGEWEREMARTTATRPLEEHPLFRELTQPGALRQLSDDELGARVLTIAAGFTRARAAALVYEDTAHAKGVLVSFGIQGRRFEDILRKLVLPYFVASEGAPHESVGLHDGFETNDRWGGMSSFGHRFSLVYPLQLTDAGRKSVLWLGYAHNARPTTQEIAHVEQLIQTLSRTLCSLTRVTALGAKAAHAEAERSQTALMLSQISHDVRTPLANVQAILHLIREGVADQREREEFIDTGLENCVALGDLVRDVIDFTRGKTGTLQTQRGLVNMNDLIARVAKQFAVNAKQRGLALAVSGDLARAQFVLGDEGQLRRVFGNLISNACKYCPSGGIEIRLRSAQSPEGNPLVEIAVIDTGLGMDENQLSQLFTPFTRFHREAAEGIGLGLTIVKWFVEQHSGTIRVTSEKGKGTCCTVLLPAAKVAALPVDTSRSLQAARKRSVLVVDDDADLVHSVARVLQTKGFEITEAVGVVAACKLIESSAFDAVITDWEMPGGGGKAVLAALRSSQERRNAESKPLVIVQCGAVDSVRTHEATELGATLVLEKPVEAAQLARVIEETPIQPIEHERSLIVAQNG